ncbi:MAG: hypothetical protein NTX42_10525 [Methanothrix sp.]|nr:hypothetical protein [Methanothrix sp.]
MDELKYVDFSLSDKEYEKVLKLSSGPPRRPGPRAHVPAPAGTPSGRDQY